MRYGMVIDLKRCIGCNSCTVACKQANGTPPGDLRTKVLTMEVGRYPHTKLEFIPVLCNHCEEPECVRLCPVGASAKQENGIVTIDPDKCLGCGYCEMACPYGARTLIKKTTGYFGEHGLSTYEQARYAEHPEGVVDKCDFCADRVARGELPVCVVTCGAGARIFGDLDDPTSEVSRLIAEENGVPMHPELGLKPQVYYIHR